MNITTIISAMVTVLLFLSTIARCEDSLSYDETVALIRTTMTGNTSTKRQERYDAIHFDSCLMNYTVSGTYPVGDPYTLHFSAIDFSRLNRQVSKVGHDYTAFVLLNFSTSFHYKDDSKEIAVRTTVVNVRDDESAQKLLAAFSHLGELCGARQNMESGNARNTQ